MDNLIKEFQNIKVNEIMDKAKNGDMQAQYVIAYYYENGLNVKQNHKTAVDWYKKSSDQGFSFAKNGLGVLYQNGIGVKQDYIKSVKFYQDAANLGHAMAKYNLGFLYENGHGVDMSHETAIDWYAKAAEHGISDAYFKLGFFNFSGFGVIENKFEAYVFISISMLLGNKSAEQLLNNINWRVYFDDKAKTDGEKKAIDMVEKIKSNNPN